MQLPRPQRGSLHPPSSAGDMRSAVQQRTHYPLAGPGVRSSPMRLETSTHAPQPVSSAQSSAGNCGSVNCSWHYRAPYPPLALRKPHVQERLSSSVADGGHATSRSLSEEFSSPLRPAGASSAAEDSEMLPSPTVEHPCSYTRTRPAHQAQKLPLTVVQGASVGQTNLLEEATHSEPIGLYNMPYPALAAEAFHAATSQLNLRPPEAGSLPSNFALNFCFEAEQEKSASVFAHTAAARRGLNFAHGVGVNSRHEGGKWEPRRHSRMTLPTERVLRGESQRIPEGGPVPVELSTRATGWRKMLYSTRRYSSDPKSFFAEFEGFKDSKQQVHAHSASICDGRWFEH